jgi:hypothetical protein
MYFGALLEGQMYDPLRSLVSSGFVAGLESGLDRLTRWRISLPEHYKTH